MIHGDISAGSVRPAEQTPAAPIRLERLEYGKFCETTAGRIENKAEHRLLGWSANFPPELIGLCSPSDIGIGADAFCFEDLSPAAPRHGTVLRPVVVGACVVPLLYRVRTRPEDGEEGQGRRYTAARYLVDPSRQASPFTLLGAMNDPPLSGVTRADVTPSLSPLAAHTAAEPELDEEARRFLRGGVEYVMSGIPVSVAELVEETVFFRWVTALWHALPPPLRPYLSAGWGVGWQLSGKLMVTFATRRADTGAGFNSKQGGTWTPPSTIVVWEGGARKKSSFDKHRKRLQPGQTYGRRVLGSSPERGLSVGALRPTAGDSYLADALAKVKRTAPDMLDPALVRALRLPGLRLRAARRLREVLDWVNEGGAVDEAAMPDSKGLVYEDYFLRAFNHSADALNQDGLRARADEVIWGCLRDGERVPYELALAGSEAPWVARARFLATLRGGDVTNILRALSLAAKAGQAEDLRPEPAEALRRALDSAASFYGADSLNAHAQLILSRVQPPAAYRGWLKSRAGTRSNAFKLALSFLKRGPDGRSLMPGAAAICEHLAFDTKLKAVESLRNWAKGFPPLDTDKEALDTLDAADRKEFAALLAAEWDVPSQDIRALRETLLAWLRLAGPVETDSPLLRLEFNLPPSESAPDSVAAEVEAESVPDGLLERVAGFTLQYWYALGERVEKSESVENKWGPWERVLDMCHDDLREALMLSPRRKGASAARLDAEQCVELVRMSRGQLLTLIARWCTKDYRGRLRRVAWMFWRWAEKAGPSRGARANVVDLCVQLSGPFISSLLEPEQRDLEAAVLLARMAGAHKFLAENAPRLWTGARAGWELKFLLAVFAEVNLEPSVEQLVGLLPHRDWLKRHLEKKKDLPPRRKELFHLATLPFHKVVYPRSNDVSWDPERCGDSVLWAAFKSVPFDQQGSLREALKKYGADPAERSELCLRYLRTYRRRKEDYLEAVRRVLKSHLLPLLRDHFDSEQVRRAMGLEVRHGRGFVPSISAPSYLKLLDRQSQKLLDEVVAGTGPEVRENALKHDPWRRA